MDVPEVRRVATPTWLNLRTLLGAALFCGAVVGGQQLLTAAAKTTGAWTAASDLAAGTVVGRDDLRHVEVRLPGEISATYASSSKDIVGWVVTRPIAVGELMPMASLVDGGGKSPIQRALTMPVSSEHAVGGDLGPGDRVDVLATFDGGDESSRTVWLGRGLEVLKVVTAGSLLGSQEAIVGITVSVTPDEAIRLVYAIRNGEIDVLRGAGIDEGGPAVIRAGDLP